MLLSWCSIVRPKVTRPVQFKSNVWLPALLVVAGLVLRNMNSDLFAFSGLALSYGGTTLFFLRDQSWLTKISSLRVFHVLSRLSYAMYLNHFLVLAYLVPVVWSPAALPKPTTISFLVGYTLFLTLSIAIAAVTFIAIESPFLRIRDKWLNVR